MDKGETKLVIVIPGPFCCSYRDHSEHLRFNSDDNITLGIQSVYDILDCALVCIHAGRNSLVPILT